MSTTPSPGWLAPARRLIRDIASACMDHVAEPPAAYQPQLIGLLRAAHALEQQLAGVTTDDAATRQHLRQLLESIHHYHVQLDRVLRTDQQEAVRQSVEHLYGSLRDPSQPDYPVERHSQPWLHTSDRQAARYRQQPTREQLLRQQLERSQRVLRRTLNRYLSDEVVDAVLENPEGLGLGGARRMVTVMLADIRGFSSLSERLSPDRVVALLNVHLGTMAEIVLAWQGTINEFIGDAVLAIFGAPVNRHDDADRAVQCALEMQQAIDDINARNAQDGLPPISMGIGLNTGPVIAGNIGSELRSKYAVVGPAVNQVARIEDACPGGNILVSATTLEAVQHLLCIGDSERLQARGMLRPIEVFQVLGVSPTANRKQQKTFPRSL